MKKPISRRQFVVGSAVAGAAAGTSPAWAIVAAPKQLSCDVLVYGSTPAGIATAVTAGRHGRKVIMACYEDHVGGIVSNGLTNSDLTYSRRSAVGGYFNDTCDRVVKHYAEVDKNDPAQPNVKISRGGQAFEPWVIEKVNLDQLKEAGVQILFRHDAKQVLKKGSRVTGIVFEHADHPEQRTQINAPVVVDATYEGDLMPMAGAAFRIGRESRSEYNEPHAGFIYMHFGSADPMPGSTGEGDKLIQAFCFRFTMTQDPALMVPLPKPAKYNRDDYKWLIEDFKSGKLTQLNKLFGFQYLPMKKTEFNSLRAGGDTGVPSESLDLAEENWDWADASRKRRQAIFDRYISHNLGMLWFVQNDPSVPASIQNDMKKYGFCKDEYNGTGIPRQVYIREVRRLIGEYILTEHDGVLAEGWQRTAVKPDSIALVEWQYDSHAFHKFDPTHPGMREGYTFVAHEVFQVPYGVVVPKTIDGLLVPLCCSATHVPYNGLRNEPIYMAIGEACGHAAHLALEANVPLRKVDIEKLQHEIVKTTGAITYFDDLPTTDPAYAACQWLGARGLNKGYKAEAAKTLTRSEGAERFTRIMTFMKNTWQPAATGGTEPLQASDVATWLNTAGYKADTAASQSGNITVGQFAQIIYNAIKTKSA